MGTHAPQTQDQIASNTKSCLGGCIVHTTELETRTKLITQGVDRIHTGGRASSSSGINISNASSRAVRNGCTQRANNPRLYHGNRNSFLAVTHPSCCQRFCDMPPHNPTFAHAGEQLQYGLGQQKRAASDVVSLCWGQRTRCRPGALINRLSFQSGLMCDQHTVRVLQILQHNVTSGVPRVRNTKQNTVHVAEKASRRRELTPTVSARNTTPYQNAHG
jgi:hypothetical protein